MRYPLLLLLLTLALDVAADAQSLADVAKREEERRKSVKAVSRVYTNGDLPHSVPVVASPPSAAAAADKTPSDESKTESGKGATAAAGDVAAPPEPTVNVHRNEKHWRDRAQSYRDRLSELRADVAAVESRLETLRAAPQTPGVLSDIKLSEQDLGKFQAQLRFIEQEWSQIEKLARESGASAWIQE